MMIPLARHLRRFRRRDEGTATIEFAILFPAFVMILLSSVEQGMITMQHSMLERGLDVAVRNVRLGTGDAPQHDEIKAQICEYAGVLKNCDTTLRLEMVQVDLRNQVAFDRSADCVDTSEAVQPVRNFVNGRENDLMLLRACVKIDPIFPTTGLGKQLAKDGAGQVALVAMSAFVQEPE
ncbi:pilus assembly protein [Marimonas arenosa]|uniref:Pilus assembly protein n=2 Tax=Marimonas arenosa TaxID=1795305 RepID=A0AAE3WAN0_9RHOB|nr:pilus assembly protein [Marimonas arenosa]